MAPVHGAQRGDFPPNVFLVARRPPPVAVPGGYQDAAGIESTVTVIGVKSVVPFAAWKVATALGVVFAGILTCWVAMRGGAELAGGVSLATSAFAFYALWSSRDQSARIEVDWQAFDVRARRWPWRRRLGLALSDVRAFALSVDGPRFGVVGEQANAKVVVLCRGIEHRESAEFIVRTLEALRHRSATAVEAAKKGAAIASED